jgi:uncharacterized phage protein (TIGR01671 family)
MNRQIKFRGRRTDHRGWAYGYYFTTPLTAEYNIQPENGAYFDCGGIGRRYVISNSDGCVFEVIPETVGQFTGLTDKNDVEIYEGDIVRYYERIGVVNWRLWELGSRYHGFYCWSEGSYAIGSDENFIADDVEVVGNVYDNPELLTTKCK